MNRQRILFVSEGADTAPTRYRALAFFDRLRAAGFEPAHHQVIGLWRRVTLLRAARHADIVVVLRKPFSPALCTLLRRHHRPLVYDIDDALFAQDDGSTPDATCRRFDAMIHSADMLWAGNPFLATLARPGAPAIVLPTSVDAAIYAGPSTAPADSFDLVWIGSSSTRKYLEGLLPTLHEATRILPSLRLKIVADFDLPPSSNLRTLPIPWSANTESASLRSAHVGIAPLPDDPWTRGKCGLKILQCMAAALPVIASPVGVQQDLVSHGQTGFLAPDPAAWLHALQQLHNDTPLRLTLGQAARQRVIDRYSIDIAFDKMLAALNQLQDR